MDTQKAIDILCDMLEEAARNNEPDKETALILGLCGICAADKSKLSSMIEVVMAYGLGRSALGR